jgi:hypothetical protein
MAHEVVPAVLPVTPGTQGLVELETVGERRANGFVEASAMRFAHGVHAILHRGMKRRSLA